MNDAQSKLKNSTRRYHEENAIKRQIKIAKQKYIENEIDQPHRFAKRHAMDCGNPTCGICGNPRRNKTLKANLKLTMQERRMFQDTDSINDRHSNGLLPDDE